MTQTSATGTSGDHARGEAGSAGPGPTRGEPILRPASPADAAAIAALWHDGWRDGHLGHVPGELHRYRRPIDFAQRVPARLPDTTVAVDGTTLLGFVIVRADELEQLYVSATARGTGVAAMLLQHAERAVAARHSQIWLAVAPGNARARRFYQREGWRDVGGLDYAAAVPGGGTLPVPCRRYEKRLTEATVGGGK